MRIAQFTESYKPVINGVAVAMDLLLEEFRQRHEVSVFAPRFSGYQDEAPEGVRIHRFPSYTTPVEREYPIAYPLAPALGTHFREARPEVVHTHSPFTLGQLGRRWARRAGVPVVTTYHTLYVEYAHYAPLLPRSLSRWGLQELSRRYCESCDAVVVPTSPIREVLLEYGVRTPIHVIPTGLRLKPPRPRDPEVRRRWGIPEHAVLTMYAGRLAREKNLPLLFESFARAARQNPDAWLLVAGSGPLEAEARELAARGGVGERIVLPGFVAPEEMPGVYAAADVFLFTSLTDTQGLVLTEAKAAGLPVVSVNAYGPGVVVRNEVDGYLREPDPQALADALSRLIREPDRRARMRENALLEAQNFSIQATASAYEALYAELTDRRR